MDPLYSQAVKSGVFGALFAALIFVPAGTIYYWQGWAFLTVFAASTAAFTVYLALYDKPLLERRIKAGPWHEKEWSQKIIVSLVFLGFFSLIIASALDVRFGWSAVRAYISLIGEALIVLSFLFIFWVIKVNSFAASTIQVTEDQIHSFLPAPMPTSITLCTPVRSRFLSECRLHLTRGGHLSL